MQHVKLGRTGLKVSRLCLGTMNFGREADERESFAIMDRALELDVDFFDTANVYGGKTGEGVTEQIIGRWLAQGGGRRDRIVLATKVYGRMGSDANDVRLSARHIRRACEESLRRLRTDHVDLYQMHHVDRDTPWDEIWQAMEQLVAQGKVIYVGSSNFAGWHIVDANAAAARRGFLSIVSEQSLYNLTARTIELEVIPACRGHGVAILPWSPLGGGLLGGVLRNVREGRRSSERIQKRVEEKRPQLERWEALCARLGAEPADVAIAWLLANPAITSPILGPRTRAQLEGAPRALEIQLSKENLAEIDTIWPGPGGEAPEAYAW